MAAKSSYKIPTSLDQNHMDMEIALQNDEGLGLRPLPVRMLLIWIIAIFVGLYAIFGDSSPIAQAGFSLKIMFIVVFVAFIYVLTKLDDAHQMRIELIGPLINYIQKQNRHILTRRSSNAAPFYNIVGIKNITDDGLIEYTDKSVGYMYAVVGSASILLFPEDRDMILSKVDDFYKKLQPDSEIIFVTAKEPQKVIRQQSHLMAQYKNLTYSDPDIDRIVKEQYNTLTNFVGKQFKSLHQYMIIKGDTKEALDVLDNIIKSECNNSSCVFKECEPLYAEDIERVLKTIYA